MEVCRRLAGKSSLLLPRAHSSVAQRSATAANSTSSSVSSGGTYAIASKETSSARASRTINGTPGHPRRSDRRRGAPPWKPTTWGPPQEPHERVSATFPRAHAHGRVVEEVRGSPTPRTSSSSRGLLRLGGRARHSRSFARTRAHAAGVRALVGVRHLDALKTEGPPGGGPSDGLRSWTTRRTDRP